MDFVRRFISFILVFLLVIIPGMTMFIPPVSAASSQCAAGEAQLNFTNNSGISNSLIYGTVTMASGTVTPGGVVNQSPSVALAGNFPTDPSDSSGNTFYVCLQSGVTSGRLWLSINSPITGLPSVQPTYSEDFRYGYIEFSYPGDVDYSNVDSFDFPINLRVYTTPGSSSTSGEALYSANTCQIYNDFRTTLAGLGSQVDWNDIYVSNGGEFVRIISPKNGLPDFGGWPDLSPYIDAVASASAGSEIIVEDYYVGTESADPDIGWFRYEGTFDNEGNLTLNGKIRGTAITGGVVTGPDAIDGEEIYVEGGSNFVNGIYMQQVGSNYEVGGVSDSDNDIYARIWNDLTSSFNYGYWGSSYGTGLSTRDFFQTFPASGTTAPSGGKPAFEPSRTIAYPPTFPTGKISYNLYASILSEYTSSYTFPFNENFGSGGKGTNPLISIPTGGLIAAELPNDGWVGSSGSTTCNTSNNSSSSSGSSSSSSSNSCSATAPTSVPDLFQINMTGTQATLYFSPVNGADDYYVAYGNGGSTNQYGVGFNYPDASGVISYTINDLAPNTQYSFSVLSGNGCASGGWGNTMQATTTGSVSSNKIFYKNIVSQVASVLPRQVSNAGASSSVLGATTKNSGTDASCISYAVQAGDTLWEIADAKIGDGKAYQAIIDGNNLSSSVIRTGQTLKVGC